MLGISDAFLQALKNKSPQDVRLEFAGGGVITGADIAITSGGLSYTEILNSATDVEFGRAVMSELDVVLINSDGRFAGFDFSREFTAEIGVGIPNDTFEVLSEEWATITISDDGYGNIRYYEIFSGRIIYTAMTINGSDVVANYYLRNGENMGVVCMILCGKRLYAIDSTYSIVAAFDIAAGTAAPEVTPTPTEYPANITREDVAGWAANKTCVTVQPVKGTPEWQWVPLGVFKGEKPDKVRGKLIEFTAHDRMSLFDKSAETFADSLTFPCTLGQIFTKLCDFCGAGYASATFPNSDKVFEKNPLEGTDYTCREILGYIAEAAGSYARMSRDGAVEIVWFADADYTVTRTDRFEMTESEFLTPPIDRLEVYNSYGDQLNTSGAGDIVYGISDNPFLYIENDTQLDGLQPYVDTIYDRITSLPAYPPSSFRAEVNPAVQCGDIISAVDDYGDRIRFPVFVQTITWNGFGKATYENTGGVIRQNAPFTQRELEQLKKKAVTAKGLYTLIDSYLSSEEGVARIVMGVGGKFAEKPPSATYSKPSGVTYGFEKGEDGYYTSTNAGKASSYSYGVFTFYNPHSEHKTIVLRCISYGEPEFDYGIVSLLNRNLAQSNTADSDIVLKSFRGQSSQTPVDLDVDIPPGASTISFKYRKDGADDQYGDYFKIKPITGAYMTEAEAYSVITQEVDNGIATLTLETKQSEDGKTNTISLNRNGIELSAAQITLVGEVVFKSDLGENGTTSIDGGRITSGQISADRIDTASLRVQKVYYYDSEDKGYYSILSSEISTVGTKPNTYTYVGPKDLGGRNTAIEGYMQSLELYGAPIYFGRPGYEAREDERALVVDVKKQTIYPVESGGYWNLGGEEHPFEHVHTLFVGLYDDGDGIANSGMSWLYASGHELFWETAGGDIYKVRLTEVD